MRSTGTVILGALLPLSCGALVDAVPAPPTRTDDVHRQLEDEASHSSSGDELEDEASRSSSGDDSAPSPCHYCYACGLDTSARPTLESLCAESTHFRVGFATMEKIVPLVLVIAALLLLKGCGSTDRQPVDHNSGKQYTSKHDYGDEEEHATQRWASVSTRAAVRRASTGEEAHSIAVLQSASPRTAEEHVDIAFCHEYIDMLGKRDTIRDMHEGLEQVTNGKLANEGVEASSVMVLQVFMPMIAASLNCTGVYSRMANIPQRDDTDPTNWFVILLTVIEFTFMHAFVAVWLLQLGAPGAMPGDNTEKNGGGCRCQIRWPTRASLKVRLIQHYQLLIGALSFNGFWFVARSKPLAICVVGKLVNHAVVLSARLGQLRDTSGNDGKQQKKKRSRIMALVDKNGDGEVSGIENLIAGLLGVVVFCVVSCLLVTIIVLIIGFLAVFIALPIIAMYVKLSQVSFVAKGYPVCDWAPPSAHDDCWDQKDRLSFITFFINIFGLSTLLESSRKGLDFMLRGSDGVVDVHEERAIATAEKLLIQGAMRRHGFLKALAFWNGFSQEKVFQIFVKKEQPEETPRALLGQDLEDGIQISM